MNIIIPAQIQTYNSVQFMESFSAKFPPGIAFDGIGITGTNANTMLIPLQNQYARDAAIAATLPLEGFIPTTNQLLPNWANTVTLPGNCSTTATPSQIIAKLTDIGGGSRDYFQNFAATAGYPWVAFSLGKPCLRTEFSVNEHLGDLISQNTFTMSLPSNQASIYEYLFCVMLEKIPAHNNFVLAVQGNPNTYYSSFVRQYPSVFPIAGVGFGLSNPLFDDAVSFEANNTYFEIPAGTQTIYVANVVSNTIITNCVNCQF